MTGQPLYLDRTRYLFSRTSIRRPGVAMTISQPSLSLNPCSSRERPPMTATVRMPSGSPNLFASSSICWASSLVDHKPVFRIQNIFPTFFKYEVRSPDSEYFQHRVQCGVRSPEGYLGSMSRDVHSCSHWLRPCLQPPPAYEGRYWSSKIDDISL